MAVDNQNPEQSYDDFNPPPEMDLDDHLPEDYATGYDEVEDTFVEATGYTNIPNAPTDFDNLMEYLSHYFQAFSEVNLPYVWFSIHLINPNKLMQWLYHKQASTFPKRYGDWWEQNAATVINMRLMIDFMKHISTLWAWNPKHDTTFAELLMF